MKQGRTLEDLAREVMRQQEIKRDYVAHTRAMSMVPIDPEIDLMPRWTQETRQKVAYD